VIADRHDPQDRVLLAMALLAAVIVAPALLEYGDLVALGLGEDLGRDGQAVGGLEAAAVAGEQDVAQRDLSPASPASFSTTILSPGATRYCLPPVRTTANIGFSLLRKIGSRARQARVRAAPLGKEGRLWQGAAGVNRGCSRNALL
jgi:hypothetical protein